LLSADDLSVQAEVPVGRAPAGVEFSDDGRRVYVANRDDNSVSVVAIEARRESERWPVGDHPFGLRLSPDGRQLWVTNVQSHDVTVLDTAPIAAAGRTLATLPVGHRPYCVAFAAGRAFVTNQYGDSLSVIDATSRHTVATIPTGAYPEGIDALGDRVWVVSWMDEVLIALDARTLKVTARVPLGSNPRGFGRFVLAE